jgi:hypothetical protein
MTKQKQKPEWKMDINEVVKAGRHVALLALELEAYLSRKAPPIHPGRIGAMWELLERERVVITDKMSLLLQLAERDAEARQARGRSPRKRRGAAGQGVKPSAN